MGLAKNQPYTPQVWSGTDVPVCLRRWRSDCCLIKTLGGNTLAQRWFQLHSLLILGMRKPFTHHFLTFVLLPILFSFSPSITNCLSLFFSQSFSHLSLFPLPFFPSLHFSTLGSHPTTFSARSPARFVSFTLPPPGRRSLPSLLLFSSSTPAIVIFFPSAGLSSSQQDY